MGEGKAKRATWDRNRITQLVRRAVEEAVGDAWELTIAVALFAIEEPEIPDGGRKLWDLVEELARAVDNQEGRRKADRLRQRLARELRPALSIPTPAESPAAMRRLGDRNAEPIRSGWRTKVRTDEEDGDSQKRVTQPVPEPLAPFNSPTLPDLPRLAGIEGQRPDDEDDGDDQDDEDPETD